MCLQCLDKAIPVPWSLLLLSWQHYYCLPERRCWLSLIQLQPGLQWLLSSDDCSVMGTKSVNGSWWQAQTSKQEFTNWHPCYLSYRTARDYVRCWDWAFHPSTDCRKCSAVTATQAALVYGCTGKFVCHLFQATTFQELQTPRLDF